LSALLLLLPIFFVAFGLLLWNKVYVCVKGGLKGKETSVFEVSE